MTAGVPGIPEHGPADYQEIPETRRFDPTVHLQLELPDQVWTLDEFGYDARQIAECASPVAVTSPFRMLSDEGVEALLEVSRDLSAHMSRIQGNRTPNHLAGGVYRSRFLRDLCASPEILDHLSGIAGTRLHPHSMPSQQLYINYAPEDLSKAVDAWHYDGIGFDDYYVYGGKARLSVPLN